MRQAGLRQRPRGLARQAATGVVSGPITAHLCLAPQHLCLGFECCGAPRCFGRLGPTPRCSQSSGAPHMWPSPLHTLPQLKHVSKAARSWSNPSSSGVVQHARSFGRLDEHMRCRTDQTVEHTGATPQTSTPAGVRLRSLRGRSDLCSPSFSRGTSLAPILFDRTRAGPFSLRTFLPLASFLSTKMYSPRRCPDGRPDPSNSPKSTLHFSVIVARSLRSSAKIWQGLPYLAKSEPPIGRMMTNLGQI